MREPRPAARDLEVEFHRPDEEGGLPLSDPVNAERADAEAEVEMQEGAAAEKDRERRPETFLGGLTHFGRLMGGLGQHEQQDHERQAGKAHDPKPSAPTLRTDDTPRHQQTPSSPGS